MDSCLSRLWLRPFLVFLSLDAPDLFWVGLDAQDLLLLDFEIHNLIVHIDVKDFRLVYQWLHLVEHVVLGAKLIGDNLVL